MDTVFINNLAVETVIGVYDWERAVQQRLLIDLELAWDNAVPGVSDNVADALDYQAVSEQVTRHLKSHHYQLLEAAAEHLAADLRQTFGLAWLRLSIRKPGAVPAADAVGVTIERGGR